MFKKPSFWEWNNGFMIVQYTKLYDGTEWRIYKAGSRIEIIMGGLIIGFGKYNRM